MSLALPARAPARPRRAQEPPAPQAVPRRARRVRPRRLSAGGAVWVVVLAMLLGGIVALNVAALRDSIDVNRLQAHARQLSDQNRLPARTGSRASPRRSRSGSPPQKLGMHPADPNTTRTSVCATPSPRSRAREGAARKRMADHRLRLMLAVSLAAFVVVVGRAVQIQGVDAASLTSKAVQQQRGETTLVGLRGSIMSADGQMLAQTQPSRTIVSNPKQIKRPEAARRPRSRARSACAPTAASRRHQPKKRHGQHTIASSCGRTRPGSLRWRRSRPRSGTADTSMRQLRPTMAARVMRHHLPGISTVPELQRWYPDGPVASQVLGFTGIDGNAGPGDGAGLEHQLNPILAGRPGKQITVTDPSGTVLDTVDVRKPQNGRNVTLTLNAAVQTKVQDVLAQTVRNTRAAWATGIVMDPRTGAVIAMATAPGYDNNQAHLASATRPCGATRPCRRCTSPARRSRWSRSRPRSRPEWSGRARCCTTSPTTSPSATR